MTPEQLTREQAIAFYDGGTWKQMTKQEIAEFQIEQDCLCVPFDIFQAAMEYALGRPVWTHEFANRDALRDELNGRERRKRSTPTVRLPAITPEIVEKFMGTYKLIWHIEGKWFWTQTAADFAFLVAQPAKKPSLREAGYHKPSCDWLNNLGPCTCGPTIPSGDKEGAST